MYWGRMRIERKRMNLFCGEMLQRRSFFCLKMQSAEQHCSCTSWYENCHACKKSGSDLQLIANHPVFNLKQSFFQPLSI
ncbi:hypothetical protein LRU_00924 [Ligilactobacillus ruminis SPM0211]|uniref:Uncharacterized protein n=1 Tax=Ligilactobacillus ruminis SPM0211 TaxID=1040964 RepID=F7QZS0_9LACO|nr:hypothetical protein LRU_00924 [Ligilactobacillus ruminis SPM0211]